MVSVDDCFVKRLSMGVCEPDNCFRSIIYNSKSRLSRTMIRTTTKIWCIKKKTRTMIKMGSEAINRS